MSQEALRMKNKKEKTMKEEKTMIDIKKLIRLRNLILTAIEITEEDKKKFEGDDEAHPALQYRLGMLHCQKDIRDKLNALIIQG